MSESAVKSRVTLNLGAALGAFFILIISSATTFAHHGSSIYDMSKTVSVKGTVTEFAFINPHSAIHLEAKDDQGNVELWLVEADSPNNLARAGWKRNSIVAGQQLTIVGNRAKDGSKVMRLQKVVFADGKELKPREGNDY